MYEDNVAGKITDDRFAKMSQKYETEQAGIAEQLKALPLVRRSMRVCNRPYVQIS